MSVYSKGSPASNPEKGNRRPAEGVLFLMNSNNRIEKTTSTHADWKPALRPELAQRAEFWRGILMGAMAGMAVATWTYSIFDRVPNLLRPPKSGLRLVGDKAA
jgi:hypothetical protein